MKTFAMLVKKNTQCENLYRNYLSFFSHKRGNFHRFVCDFFLRFICEKSVEENLRINKIYVIQCICCEINVTKIDESAKWKFNHSMPVGKSMKMTKVWASLNHKHWKVHKIIYL